ncbi:hypothetical protein DPMN_082364 [Dreissena polymorpha]|uniref:Uncharacterized protein n=1 Tax=Dreissena polymorpha TaxID=45954 RepID=A0A9D3Y958_DREPO|nr:hypothetical protein DPMN_082364 [Dreissena polymorpha]
MHVCVQGQHVSMEFQNVLFVTAHLDYSQSPAHQIPYQDQGPKTLFSVTEGEQFVCHFKYRAEIGYGYSRREIVRLAISHGKKNNSEPCLSDYWFSGLKKRWRDIHVAKVASCQGEGLFF